MERKNKKPAKVIEVTKVEETPVIVETRLQWQKIGGGSLRWQNRIIKPGEIFLAHLADLSKAFMDTLICLDSEGLKKVKEKEKEETQTPEVLYHKVELGEGFWNICNEEDKAINEKPLTEKEAEELLLALML